MTCFNNLSNDGEFLYTLSRHHVDNNLVVSSSSIFIPQSIHSIPFPFFRLSCKRVHIYIFSFLFLILSHSLKGNNPVIYNSHCWKWRIRKAKNMLFCMVYFFLFFSFFKKYNISITFFLKNLSCASLSLGIPSFSLATYISLFLFLCFPFSVGKIYFILKVKADTHSLFPCSAQYVQPLVFLSKYFFCFNVKTMQPAPMLLLCTTVHFLAWSYSWDEMQRELTLLPFPYDTDHLSVKLFFLFAHFIQKIGNNQPVQYT